MVKTVKMYIAHKKYICMRLHINSLIKIHLIKFRMIKKYIKDKDKINC